VTAANASAAAATGMGYPTKALMDAAAGSYTPGQVVRVADDPTPANNGDWIKGVSVFTQSSFDRVAVVEAKTAIIRAASPLVPTLTVLGSYVSNTGVVTINAAFAYSEMSVVSGSFLFCRSDFFTTTQYGAYFDASGNFLSTIGSNAKMATNSQKYITKVPALAETIKYNMLVGNVATTLMYQDYRTLSPSIADALFIPNQDMPFIYNIADFLGDYGLFDWGYIYSNGVLNNSLVFNSTLPIRVIPGDVITVSGYITSETEPSGLTSRGVFLDSSFRYVSGLPVVDSRTPSYVVPDGISYVMITYMVAEIANLSIKKEVSPSAAVTLRENTTVLTGKMWASLGDSITYQSLWQPTVVARSGCSHQNFGIGSTHIAGTGVNSMWRDVRIDAVAAAVPDLVTIMGGANDWLAEYAIGTDAEYLKPLGTDDNATLADPATYKNVLTFKGAYSAIIEKLLASNPKHRLFILATPWLNEAGYTPSGTRLPISAYSDACRSVAAFYGIPCIQLDREMGANALTKTTMFSDNVHPNTYGGERMAEIVLARFLAHGFIAI
jgi:lysophospholipase L1-like esterase